jgi:hypothetical protein
MEDYDSGRNQSQLNAHKKASCDEHSIEKIMQPVADEVEVGESMGITPSSVAVSPRKKLLERKEQNHTHYYQKKSLFTGQSDGFRQKMQERTPDQRT